MKHLLAAVLLLLPVSAAIAAPALTGCWTGNALTDLRVAGRPLPGVQASLTLLDPRTGKPADPSLFKLECRLVPRGGYAVPRRHGHGGW